ncbi:MAG: hypothetical protein LUC88_00050 [Prevotella sp.]|nr:hypothetical protein [Prevotella sp.]
MASKHNPINICTIAIRRTAVGEIRFPVGVKSGEDLYFLARLMIDNKMVLSTRPTYIYHNSVKVIKRLSGTHEKQDECFDSLLKLDCKDKYLRHYVALWHTWRVVGGIRRKDPKTIIYHFWRSLQIRPFQTKIFTAMLSALIWG